MAASEALVVDGDTIVTYIGYSYRLLTGMISADYPASRELITPLPLFAFPRPRRSQFSETVFVTEGLVGERGPGYSAFRWATGAPNAIGKSSNVTSVAPSAFNASAVFDAAEAGASVSAHVRSENLLDAIPTLYQMASQRIPAVFHVQVAHHITREDGIASVAADLSTLMSLRDTGCILIASYNVKECQDMAVLAHQVALQTSLPVIHFFDGVRGTCPGLTQSVMIREKYVWPDDLLTLTPLCHHC